MSTNLKQMRTFYLVWPFEQIRQTVSDELPCAESVPEVRLVVVVYRQTIETAQPDSSHSKVNRLHSNKTRTVAIW